MGFFREEYWSGLPLPSPGNLPDPGGKLRYCHCRQTLYHLSHGGGLFPNDYDSCSCSLHHGTGHTSNMSSWCQENFHKQFNEWLLTSQDNWLSRKDIDQKRKIWAVNSKMESIMSKAPPWGQRTFREVALTHVYLWIYYKILSQASTRHLELTFFTP